jgi:hypothetical protein
MKIRRLKKDAKKRAKRASSGKSQNRDVGGTSGIVTPHWVEATFSHSVPLVVSQSEGQESKSKSQQSSQILKSLQCLDEEGQSAEVVQAWLGTEKRSNQNKNRARNELDLPVVARHFGGRNGTSATSHFFLQGRKLFSECPFLRSADTD